MAGNMRLALLLGFIQWSLGSGSDDVTLHCRDSWVNSMTYAQFTDFACSKCFIQVFFNEKGYAMDWHPPFALYPKKGTVAPNNNTYVPDAEMTSSRVCRDLLTEEECRKWKACCLAARVCCLETQQSETQEADDCPATWDGVSCWSATPPSSAAAQECPSYYVAKEITWRSPKAHKICDSNGSWSMHPEHGLEITKYTECFDTETYIHILKISLYIDLSGHTLSLVSLLTAIILTLSVRNLRLELLSRSSLKLHFNLFISVMLMDLFIIGTDCIYLDGLQDNEELPIYKQNPPWCKVLHFFTKYFRSSTYMCMFCEGLYLYRRISNVMKVGVDEGLVKYFVISWTVPVITVTSYAVTRVALGQNDNCWIDNALNYLEFIYIVPYLMSLACNLIFLISIEWMLCTKMRSDTSDRRVAVLRHALRATLSLIPVFGLQLLFIIYRPAYCPPYEVIAAVFTSTQGFLVSVLYCFSTKEVRQELRDICYDCKVRRRMRRSRKMSAVSTSTKISRLSFPRASIDMLLAKARRFSPKSPPNGVVYQSPVPMAVVKTDERRDSNLSQATRTTSFISSVASVNSQTVVKVDITPPKSCHRAGNGAGWVPLARGRSDSSPGERPRNLPDGQRRTVAAIVVNDIDDNTNDCLAPLMYSDRNEADVSAVTMDTEICAGLSPIAEADSSA